MPNQNTVQEHTLEIINNVVLIDGQDKSELIAKLDELMRTELSNVGEAALLLAAWIASVLAYSDLEVGEFHFGPLFTRLFAQQYQLRIDAALGGAKPAGNS